MKIFSGTFAPVLILTVLSLAIVWSVLAKGGVWPADWQVALIGIAFASGLYWAFCSTSRCVPKMSPWLLWPTYLIPAYLVFQLVPLPLGTLQILSPARAELLMHLAPVITGVHSAPLSVNPPAALLHLFTFLGYILTFLLSRELAWRFPASPWALCIPLIVVGFVEAIIGLAQIVSTWPTGSASGTYTNRDHFSGLLEMILPLACVYGLVIFRRGAAGSQFARALAACSVWLLAALMLVGIIYSESRMGFLVALFTLFFLGIMAVIPRDPTRAWRLYSLATVALAVILMSVFLPPSQLLARFAIVSSGGEISADTRLQLWKETLPLISEFRFFGCGLGGYESVFLKYQDVSNNLRVEFAHNDYLQCLAELGFAGSAVMAVFFVSLLTGIFRRIFHEESEDSRLLSIACAAALIAIGLHSLVDFNLYVPVNAMTVAWIAGVGSLSGPAPIRSFLPKRSR